MQVRMLTRSAKPTLKIFRPWTDKSLASLIAVYIILLCEDQTRICFLHLCVHVHRISRWLRNVLQRESQHVVLQIQLENSVERRLIS